MRSEEAPAGNQVEQQGQTPEIAVAAVVHETKGVNDRHQGAVVV